MNVIFANIFLTKIIFRKNDNKKDKNNQPYTSLDIFKPINATINIFYLLLLAEFADPN